MDAADATPLSAWASIRGYFTPATLFLVLNLVIGTIALTSRSHQRRRREHHHDYAHHHHQEPPLDPHQQHEYHYYQPQYVPAPAPPAPLACTSSVLDRLRSIGLYRFRSGDFPPEYGAGAAGGHDSIVPPVEEETAKQYARSRSEPSHGREERSAPSLRMKKSGAEVVRKTQVARAPATRVVEAVAEDEAVDARAEELVVGSRREPASPQKAEYHYQEEERVPPPAPMRAPQPLSRTSSVLDRLRSLGLYSFLGAEQPAAPETDGVAAPSADKKQANAHYDTSRSEPGKKEKNQAAEPKTAKSSSATRKPTSAAPPLAGQQSVDLRAEAFIDSFRREQSQKQVHHDENEHVVPPPPAPLARTSSVLDRLRSFSLYLRSGDPVPEEPYKAADEKQQAQYARSRSEAAREQAAKKKKKKQQSAEARVSKTSSEAVHVAEECVDARATTSSTSSGSSFSCRGSTPCSTTRRCSTAAAAASSSEVHSLQPE